MNKTVIVSVDPKSPADRRGVKAGETLQKVNGHDIVDVLDYKFYTYDPELTLTLERDGVVREVTVRKGEGDELGLNFETYMMDSPAPAPTTVSSASWTSCPVACGRRSTSRTTTPGCPFSWGTTSP